MWQRSKLHSTWICSAYILEPSLQPAMTSRSGFCDLQQVFGCTARDTYALLHKQLSSINCPHPVFVEEGSEPPGNPTTTTTNVVLRSFVYCSDGGSDQSKYKKLLALAARNSKSTFVVPTSCILHAQQLVVKDSLGYMDGWSLRRNKKWKYFPSLAKLIYVWRDHAPSCLSIWRRLFGDTSAAQHACKLPAKTIAGRWGSIFACHVDLEEYLGFYSVCFYYFYFYFYCFYPTPTPTPPIQMIQ